MAELEKQAASTIAESGEAWKRDHKHSGSAPVKITPRELPARRTSSSSETSSPDCSTSSSLTSNSCDSYSPGLLNKQEQKKLLVDRLMDHFFKLLASNSRQHVGAGSPSKNTSQSSSTSSSPSEPNGLLCASGTRAAPRRRNGTGKGKRAAKHDGDSDEEEDDGRRSKAKMAKTEEFETRRLACPFFKRNPHRYKEERSCVGPGWMTVHRVK